MLSFREKMWVFGSIFKKVIIIIERVQEKFVSINSNYKIPIK